MFSRGGKAPPDPPKEKGPWAPDFLGGPGPQKLFLGPWAPPWGPGGPQGRWAQGPGLKADGPQGPGASRPMGPMGGDPWGPPKYYWLPKIIFFTEKIVKMYKK